jgi:hypothetical protein
MQRHVFVQQEQVGVNSPLNPLKRKKKRNFEGFFFVYFNDYQLFTFELGAAVEYFKLE